MRSCHRSNKKAVENVVILIEGNGNVSLPILKSLTRVAFSLNPKLTLEDWYKKLKSPWCG